MKFVSFRVSDRVSSGALVGDRVVDFGPLLNSRGNVTKEQHFEGTVASVRELAAACAPDTVDISCVVRSWAAFGTELEAALQQLVRRADSDALELSRVELLSPLPRPSSLRDGYAFRQHVETMRRNRGAPMIDEFDLFPVFYFGNHQAVFGPGDFPVQAEHLRELDYELEVAVVIGREGRNIKAVEADDYVFGLCIMNDMSARALQREEMKLSLGPAKGKDFGTVLGPWLVTKESLTHRITRTPRGNVYDLQMRASVNGRLLSEGNLSTMHWTFAEIIERASYGVTLYPGDVIGSGTVGTGCLAELNSSKITDNLWLKAGDVVALEVEELGVLENRIVLSQE